VNIKYVLNNVIKPESCLGNEADTMNILALLLDEPLFWPLIFPYIYRLERCGIADRGAIEYFIIILNALLNDDVDKAGNNMPPWAGSNILFDIITYSELYDQSWSVDKENALLNSALFPLSSSLTMIQRSSYYSNYIYSDPYANLFPLSTTSKILIQNGDIDTRTPLSWAQYYNSRTTNLYPQFVMYNNSAHGLTVPSRNPTNGNHTCAIQSFSDFIYNIQSPVNNSCLKNILPYRVSVNDSRALISLLQIPFDAYEDGILPFSFASVIAIIVVVASIFSCLSAIVSYFICCRKFDVEVPVQYTLT